MDSTGEEKPDVAVKALDVKAHGRVSFKRGNDCRKDAFKHE
jgi:hypothetical protein